MEFVIREAIGGMRLDYALANKIRLFRVVCNLRYFKLNCLTTFQVGNKCEFDECV